MTERTLSSRPVPRTEPNAPAHRPRLAQRLRLAHRPRLALSLLLTCQLMLILDVTVMNVALPRVQAALHFSPTDLSWVINAYTLAYGGLLLLGGRAGDLFGRRRVFVAGVAVFTLASLVGGLAPSAGWLLTARVAQGLGAAAAGPNTLALITTTFTEPRERVRALALFSGVASAGFAIGLIVGGLLTELLSWRWVLFINVPFGAAVAVLAPRFVRDAERHPARLDLPGAIVGSAGVASLVYAFIRAASAGWGESETLIPLVAGLVLLAAFVPIESRARQPLMPLHLFADRGRASAYLNFFLGPMALMSMFFFLTQFLQEVAGFDALATGFAFLPMAVTMFTVTRLIPRLLPRFGPRPLTVIGAILVIIALGWLSQLSTTSGYASDVLVPVLLLGIGAGLSFAPLNVLIMSRVPAQDAGAAGGVLQTMQQVGTTLGLAVLVTIFGSAVRNAPRGAPAHEVLVTGMTHAFVAAIVVATCMLVIALTFRREPSAP